MKDGVVRKGMEGRSLRGDWTDDDLGFSRCLGNEVGKGEA